MKQLEKKNLLNVGITNATERQILEYMIQGLKEKGENYYVVTPNPEILVHASKNKEFRQILNNARLALPDGIGVIWAGKIVGKSFHERVTGVDLLEKLCNECSKKPITVGFLGGGPKIAELTAECLVSKFPGLKVAFAGEDYNRYNFYKNYNGYIDILFVAFGFPKQEEWMISHINKIPARVMIGVGGSFDYLSGNVSRAPVWIRSLGFEWLFRLIVQPWRVKRQLALLEFIFLILKEKLRSNN
ncbi:MAG: WecB/TagA/CpsF family glycosyltransferase [Candidatus Levybacteria bacterium]|nr:WecB/TagA/CpsF family glycosyltransferase [Candidatus Levybacteria bacterium]